MTEGRGGTVVTPALSRREKCCCIGAAFHAYEGNSPFFISLMKGICRFFTSLQGKPRFFTDFLDECLRSFHRPSARL
ncbi:hypothetical protein B4113_2929 [Geobacillus sp. B4113_201601]|nr:hypothetical protein B4113_2929 [Geobacillus sp. B4113_201601]